MKLVGIIDEDFINYRKPSMVLEFPYCDFKCMKECGMQVCQNLPLASMPIIEVKSDTLIKRFINNPITEAIVMQGLEPLSEESFPEILEFIRKLPYKIDVVIYTGYDEFEVVDKVEALKDALPSIVSNLIIKFGRFKPNQQYHYDEILGVNLASENQYAKQYHGKTR